MEIHDIDVGWLNRDRWVVYITDGDRFVLYVRPFCLDEPLAAFVIGSSFRGGMDHYSVSYGVHAASFDMRLASFDHGRAILASLMDLLAESGHLRFWVKDTDLVWVCPRSEVGDYRFIRFVVERRGDHVLLVVSVSSSLTIYDMRLPYGPRMLVGAWQYHHGLFLSDSGSSVRKPFCGVFARWIERYRLWVRRFFNRGQKV